VRLVVLDFLAFLPHLPHLPLTLICTNVHILDHESSPLRQVFLLFALLPIPARFFIVLLLYPTVDLGLIELHPLIEGGGTIEAFAGAVGVNLREGKAIAIRPCVNLLIRCVELKVVKVVLWALHHAGKAIEKLFDFSFLLGRLDAIAVV
jgi:hypothetical protein